MLGTVGLQPEVRGELHLAETLIIQVVLVAQTVALAAAALLDTLLWAVRVLLVADWAEILLALAAGVSGCTVT
jgi:hypothetical protein